VSNGDAGAVTPPPQIIALGPAFLQQGVVIPSFAQFAVTGEDNVRVTAVASVGGVTVQVQGRFLDALQGKTIPFSYPVQPGSNRVPVSALFPLGTGYLLNLTAFVTGPASVLMGTVYVIVQIIRGLTGATYLLGTLIAGYITTVQAIGFPGSAIVSSVAGEPAVRTILGTNQGVGNAINEVVPSGARWELLSFACNVHDSISLSGSGVALLLQSSGAVTKAVLPVQFAFSNTTDTIVTWLAGFAPLSTVPIAGGFPISAPVNHRLLAGEIITSNTGANRTYQNLVYTVREWLEVG
jgi:hypothetical protein